MDIILQGIPHTICYIDDICVTGANDDEHVHNLEGRLKHHGITVKPSKCKFFCESVEYLGHVVDAEGLHAKSDKIDAIVNAPKPQNIQELRSFLGLINYYRKFIPNLATILQQQIVC